MADRGLILDVAPELAHDDDADEHARAEPDRARDQRDLERQLAGA